MKHHQKKSERNNLKCLERKRICKTNFDKQIWSKPFEKKIGNTIHSKSSKELKNKKWGRNRKKRMERKYFMKLNGLETSLKRTISKIILKTNIFHLK